GVVENDSHGVATQRSTAPTACSWRPPSYESAPPATPNSSGGAWVAASSLLADESAGVELCARTGLETTSSAASQRGTKVLRGGLEVHTSSSSTALTARSRVK